MSRTPTNGENGSGVKEQLRALTEHKDRHQSNIDELYKKYEGVGKTNWQIVLSALGVAVVVLGGLQAMSSAPINDDLKRLDRESRKAAESVSAHQANIAAMMVQVTALERRAGLHLESIGKLEDSRLPIREFAIHQSANTRQIDDLNKKVDAVFPPSKVLEDLVRRLSELERTRATNAAASAGKP